MVRTGKVSRVAETYDRKCVVQWHGKLGGLVYLATKKAFRLLSDTVELLSLGVFKQWGVFLNLSFFL